MGSDKHYPEERPQHRVTVDGFWIDRDPVSNERFARFVEATGHTTFAEIPPAIRPTIRMPFRTCCMRIVGVRATVRRRGSQGLHELVEVRARRDWRHPYGAADTNAGLEAHPVVHVTFNDAEACARWEGKEIPRKPNGNSPRAADWTARPSRGATILPNDLHLANTWQGEFPWQHRSRTDTNERRLWCIPAERLRAVRHDRQCLGMDGGLVSAAASR